VVGFVEGGEGGAVCSGWIAKSRRSFPGPWGREVPVAAAALGVLVLFGCEEEQLVLIYVPVLGMKTGPPSVNPSVFVPIGALADGPVGGRAVRVPAPGVQTLIADKYVARPWNSLVPPLVSPGRRRRRSGPPPPMKHW